MKPLKNERRRLALVTQAAIAAVAALLASACGGGSPAASGGPTRGVTINVALAYPAPPNLSQFEKATGIKVNWSNIQWDDLQTKIAAAAEAHTYFADVTDVDWSKTGEYYINKWFVPLNSYFKLPALKAEYPQVDSFIRKGVLVGVPSDASMMVTTVNTADFRKAGITAMPTTISQYMRDLAQIRQRGVVVHPLGIPFAAAEGLSTYWYETTAAFGGSVLSPSYNPLFTSPSSPGYQAMEWMVHAYRSGLVPPANVNMTDEQDFETNAAHNLTASVFSDYSGDVSTIYDVPSQSRVVGEVSYIPTPGKSGEAPNLANPDGIGIPAQAQHVAAAVKFIKWFDEPANQAAFAGAGGPSKAIAGFPLPANKAGLQMLVQSGKVQGAAMMAKLLEGHSRAIFPGGAPPWYAAFSHAVYTNLHSAAAGQETVHQAIAAIASQVASLHG